MHRVKKFNENNGPSLLSTDHNGLSLEERLNMEMKGYYDAIQDNLDLIVNDYINEDNDELIISELEKMKKIYNLEFIVDRTIDNLRN